MPPSAAGIVSAASLLAILEDKHRGLGALWKCVRPGGAMLIIEPTKKMTVDAAEKIMKKGFSGREARVLRTWTFARRDKAVDPRMYNELGASSAHFKPLLHGLVGCWLIRKKKTGSRGI
jgi:hypothetical protein